MKQRARWLAYAAILLGLSPFAIRQIMYREQSVEGKTHAWAYALVARFGNDPKEQAQALAKAFYLDRQSNWAGGTSKELRDSAAKFPSDHAFFPLHRPGTESRHL